MTWAMFMDAASAVSGARDFVGVTAAVLLVALLVNVFARHRRRELRRAVILYLVYALGIVLQVVAARFGPAGGTQWLGILTDIVLGLALVHLTAIVVIDLAFVAVAIELPTLIVDVLVGIAYCIATGTVLSMHGVDLTSFVAVSTVAAAVLTLGLQNTVGNVIGGLALQFDGSIEPNQWVQLDNGKQGKVKVVRWRHTLLETRDGDTLVVPNATLLQSNILVLGKRDGKQGPHRMWVSFQVDFRFAPTRVIGVVEEALRNQAIPNIATDPPLDCICMDFARDGHESYVIYSIRYWLVDLAKDDPTSSRVRERLYAAMTRAEIPFAIPMYRTQVIADSQDARRESRVAKARQAMDSVELFRPMTPDERQSIAECLVPAWFAPGEVMTRQGAVAHWLYVLASGKAEIRVQSEGGSERLVTTIEGPGFFGEMGLMTGESRTASVVAVTACDCYRLDRGTFEQVIKQRPEIAQEVATVLAERRVRLGLVAKRQSIAPGMEDAEARELLKRVRSFFGL